MECNRQRYQGNEGMSSITYRFNDQDQEFQYHQQIDEQYPWYLFASTTIYIMIFGIQIMYLPRQACINQLIYMILVRLLRKFNI